MLSRPLEDSQLFILFCQLAFETCNLGRHLQFTFRRRLLILLFTAPVVELWFIQAEFTGCGSNNGMCSASFRASLKPRRMLLTGFLLVDTVFVFRESPWLSLLPLSRVHYCWVRSLYCFARINNNHQGSLSGSCMPTTLDSTGWHNRNGIQSDPDGRVEAGPDGLCGAGLSNSERTLGDKQTKE